MAASSSPKLISSDEAKVEKKPEDKTPAAGSSLDLESSHVALPHFKFPVVLLREPCEWYKKQAGFNKDNPILKCCETILTRYAKDESIPNLSSKELFDLVDALIRYSYISFSGILHPELQSDDNVDILIPQSSQMPRVLDDFNSLFAWNLVSLLTEGSLKMYSKDFVSDYSSYLNKIKMVEDNFNDDADQDFYFIFPSENRSKKWEQFVLATYVLQKYGLYNQAFVSAFLQLVDKNVDISEIQKCIAILEEYPTVRRLLIECFCIYRNNIEWILYAFHQNNAANDNISDDYDLPEFMKENTVEAILDEDKCFNLCLYILKRNICIYDGRPPIGFEFDRLNAKLDPYQRLPRPEHPVELILAILPEEIRKIKAEAILCATDKPGASHCPFSLFIKTLNPVTSSSSSSSSNAEVKVKNHRMADFKVIPLIMFFADLLPNGEKKINIERELKKETAVVTGPTMSSGSDH